MGLFLLEDAASHVLLEDAASPLALEEATGAVVLFRRTLFRRAGSREQLEMSGYEISHNSAAYPLVFPLVSSTDHIAPVTGASPTVLISKNGGAFATPIGLVSELGNGWYQVAGNAGDTSALGPLVLHATAIGADPTDALYPVVAVDPQTATPPANVVQWVGQTVPSTNVTGVPVVDVGYSDGIDYPMGHTAAATSTTITLDDSSAIQDDFYRWQAITIESGTGAGQVRLITAYSGTNFTATISRPWTIVPDTTSIYSIGGSAETNLIFLNGVAAGQAIANAVWADATASDFTTAGTPGMVLVGQLGGAFTTTSSSVLTSAALANAPAGGSGGATASEIATAVWGDLLASSDFATTGSVGALVKANTVVSVSGAVGSVVSPVTVGSNQDKTGYSLATAPPTAAAIATAVWTDATASDFATVGTPGKVLVGQLGGAFTTTSSSVYTSASLANAPAGGSGGATASEIATAVWTDLASSSDFQTAGSIGALVQGNLDAAVSSRSTYAGGPVASVTAGVTVAVNNDKSDYALAVAPPTAAAIATAVLTDTTPSDLATAGSIGHVIATQLGGAFTTTSSSVLTSAALANAPSGGSGGATASEIATAVWADLLASSDFTTTGSVGALVKANTVASVSGAVGSVVSPVTVGTNQDKTGYGLTEAFPTNFAALVIGQSGGVTVATNQDKAGYQLDLAQPVPTSNTAQTVGDALNAARAQGFGKWAISGTTLSLYGADGTTVVRTFTLDSATAPTQRS